MFKLISKRNKRKQLELQKLLVLLEDDEQNDDELLFDLFDDEYL